MSHDKDWGKPGSTRHAKKITPGQANEGTWAIPKTPKDKAALKKLMSQPIKLGKEGDEAAGKIYSLIGDDELFDDLYVAGKKNPNGDARPIIKKHMKRLRISEAKDPNEYDKEGEMMKNQLRQICSANEKLMKMVGDDDNLPEWVQNKVTKATDYIRSVRDYLEAENGNDDEKEMDEAAPTKKPFDFVGYAKQGMKYDKQKGKMVPKEEMDEAKLDEISTDKLNKYYHAAKQSKNRATNSAVATILRKGDHSKDLNTMRKREKGIKLAKSRAVHNLRKNLK